MTLYRLYQVDAFTKEKFKGNPAGVVSNADGLSDTDMQRIAREMNCSETAFIVSSKDPELYDFQVRYFTPTTEVPLCGHATIAAHYVLAKELELTEKKQFRTKTGVGILPIDILLEHGNYNVVMTQGSVVFGDVLNDKQQGDALTALGLSLEDIRSEYPIQIVSTGHSKILFCIKSREKLNRLQPDFKQLTLLSRELGSNGYFVFTLDTPFPDVLTCGRMFAPAIGINEDPVTGNAHGPLGVYLAHYNCLPVLNQVVTFKGMQGEAIGRTGFVTVTVHLENKTPTRVQISGDAVIVFQTELQN